MYSGLTQKQAKELLSMGREAVDMMFDTAHNFVTDPTGECVDWTDEDWRKITLWENHLERCLTSVLSDVEFDLPKLAKARTPDDTSSWEEMIKYLEHKPSTWYPAMLFKLAEICLKKPIFVKGAMSRIIAKIENKFQGPRSMRIHWPGSLNKEE